MAFSLATALLIGGIASGVGSVAAGAMGSSAANNAANLQAQAANQAGQLQYQASQDALAEQRRQFNITQGNIAPWLQTGQGALGNLAYLMGIPSQAQAQGAAPPASGGAPPTLPPGVSGLPPTGGSGGGGDPMFAGGDPSGGWWKFPEGEPVSLAALGGNANGNPIAPPTWGADVPPPTGGGLPVGKDGQPLVTSGPGVPQGVNPALGGYGSLMQPYGQNFTAPDPNKVFDDPAFKFRLGEGLKALENSAAARGGLLSGATALDLNRLAQGMASDEYSNIYNRQLGEFQQAYNIYNQNQGTQFNRLSALSGGGQVAANQIGQLGSQFANSAGNLLMLGGDARGNALNNAANARASGYINGANAWGGAIGGGINSLTDLLAIYAKNRTP